MMGHGDTETRRQEGRGGKERKEARKRGGRDARKGGKEGRDAKRRGSKETGKGGSKPWGSAELRVRKRNIFAIRKMDVAEITGVTWSFNRGFAIRNSIVSGKRSFGSLSGLKSTSSMWHD